MGIPQSTVSLGGFMLETLLELVFKLQYTSTAA